MFDGQLASRVALVTASTSGIGAQIAEDLGRAGARAVVINGRDEAAGRAVEARLKANVPDTEFLFIAADLGDPAAIAELFARTAEAFGGLDILVHCGMANATGSLQHFVDMPPEAYDKIVHGLYLSLIHCCRHAVPHMRAAGAGAIVSIASDAAKVPTPGESVIGGAMAAVVMFLKTLAVELSKDHIRTNIITPSIVRDTRSYDYVMAQEFSRKLFMQAERRARLGVPTPKNIAPMAVFLASPLASHITGQVISVNGGISVS